MAPKEDVSAFYLTKSPSNHTSKNEANRELLNVKKTKSQLH